MCRWKKDEGEAAPNVVVPSTAKVEPVEVAGIQLAKIPIAENAANTSQIGGLAYTGSQARRLSALAALLIGCGGLGLVLSGRRRSEADQNG